MKYEFTERALESLSGFPQQNASRILNLVEEAAEENFFNHESYSCIYDTHGNPWDKLDFKKGELNHRIFFTKVDEKVFILDAFERDNIDYSDRKLYDLLQRMEKQLKEEV